MSPHGHWTFCKSRGCFQRFAFALFPFQPCIYIRQTTFMKHKRYRHRVSKMIDEACHSERGKVANLSFAINPKDHTLWTPEELYRYTPPPLSSPEASPIFPHPCSMILHITSLMLPSYAPVSLVLILILLSLSSVVSTVCVHGECTPATVPRNCIPAHRLVHGRTRRHTIPQAQEAKSALSTRGNGICFYPTTEPCIPGVDTARFVLPLGRYALKWIALNPTHQGNPISIFPFLLSPKNPLLL